MISSIAPGDQSTDGLTLQTTKRATRHHISAKYPPGMSPNAIASPQNTSQDSPRRIKIYVEDDTIRQRSQQTIQKLLAVAMSDDQSSACSGTAALLAKKALKYRKLLHRVAGIDVTSPSFDAAKFLGVDWCHTPCLKAHCQRS